MMRELLSGGFVPELVIEERSNIAAKELDAFVARVSGWPVAPSLDELLGAHETRRERVEHHNRRACEALLEELAPDLIVLGGTRILKPRIFERARHGTLNAHPGLLPQVRGSASVAWAVHRDEPIGGTCHFVERGVDTGPIVGRRALPVRRGHSYERLCHDTDQLCATLMREALESFRDGTLVSTPQGEGGPAHRTMPSEGVAEVRRRLAAGAYSHFVD